MTNYHNSYDHLADSEKLKLIKNLYTIKKMSFADIAKQYHTYANKIRRDAKKFNITIRDKSEAQKNALQTGKHSHPTKGKERSDATKQKIGKSVMEAWDGLSEQQLKKRKKQAKNNWDKMDSDTKINMQKAAIDAVRKTSKVGSKMEKFIQTKLLNAGYKVDFHKEHSLVNTKLQIDLFLPTINLAIEVDGPSHFAPVWGEQSLKRNISYDQKKEGLIIGKGWHLIRVKQTKDFSPSRANVLCEKIFDVIKRCSSLTTATKFNIED